MNGLETSRENKVERFSGFKATCVGSFVWTHKVVNRNCVTEQEYIACSIFIFTINTNSNLDFLIKCNNCVVHGMSLLLRYC